MEIYNFQDGLHGQPVIGTFSIYIPALQLTIHKVKIIRSKTGKVFLSYPSYSEDDPDTGKKKFYPYLEFSREKKELFEQKVFEALKPYVAQSRSPSD